MDLSGQKQTSVEDLASRFSDINVEHRLEIEQTKCVPHQFNDSTNLQFHQYQPCQQNYLEPIKNQQLQDSNLQCDQARIPQVMECNARGDENENENTATYDNYILIVTNVDPSVFHEDLAKSKFESLFFAYGDPTTVKFTYLKSFKRVRVDFANQHAANSARDHLDRYKLGQTHMRCFNAQMINFQAQDDSGPCQFLSIPKPTKQFLISPPASPPVGWEPVNEGSPCIDVQLISAIANLVPGKVHEIHPASESQPAIIVEVCEDAQFEAPSHQTTNAKTRIPKTPNPNFQLCTAMDSI